MAFTKAQLEALKNSLLASGQPINAATHRELVQKLIDELYDAQSRGDLLSSVQATATTQAGDVVLVIRSGQAYLIPATEFGAAGIALGDLTNTVIVDPQDGDVLAYNAVTEKWENISSDLGATAVPYTGAVGSVNLGEFGLSAGFLKLDTTPTGTPTDAGTMFWDEDDQTVDIRLNGYVMKIGEDLFYPVKNQTGASIPKGTAVRFAGTLGSSGRLLIEPFLADGSQDSRNFMGVTAEAIADGADGKVLWFGRIRGIDTSAFSEGDVLYASPSTAGSFTATRPTFPENIISVAAVINDSATQGVIFVRPRTEFLQGGGVSGGLPVWTGADTLADTGMLVSGTSLETASGVLNLQPSGGADRGVNLTPRVNAYSDGETGVLRNVVKTGRLILTGGNRIFEGANIILHGDVSGNKNEIHFRTDDTERARISATGNVGIGTTTPGEKLEVDGAAKASTFYSEKITVTLSTNGVDVNVKTFAATDKKIFRATAMPTDNTDLYALADFSKLYDGTNSVFRKSGGAGSNMVLDVDGLNGSILVARATSATGENKEIEVSIIYYV